MPESEVQNPRLNRDQLLLEATGKYWWQRRKFIIAALFSAAVVFAIILFLIPSRFRSQASVIIMPPRFAPEVRTNPLTVPTAQALLETNELYSGVLQSILRQRDIAVKLAGTEDIDLEAARKLDNMSTGEIQSAAAASPDEAESFSQLDVTEILGLGEFDSDEIENLNADAIGEMLYSEESIDKKTASELEYSPVIQLYAVSDSGNKAQLLANTWAKLFEDKYESITRGQTERLNQSLENQQKAGQDDLEAMQKILVEFRLKNDLDLIARQIRDKTDDISTFSQQIVGRKNEYAGLLAKKQVLLETARSLEVNGAGWLGNVLEDGATSSVTAAMPGGITSESLLSAKTLLNKNDYLDALSDMSMFYQENQVELLKSQEEALRKELVEDQNALRVGRVRQEILEQSLRDRNAEIAQTSQVLSLVTALPNEVIGTAIATDQSRQIQRAASVQLFNDRLNPLWEKLVDQRADITRQLAEVKAEVLELEQTVPEKEESLADLASRSLRAQQDETLYKARLRRAEAANQTLYNGYNSLQEEQFQTELRLGLLKEEIATLEGTVVKLRRELDDLRLASEESSTQLELLELRKKAIEARASLLTQKLQESAVAVGEQVSDIFIASRAVAPVRHYFPPRTILLAVMLLISAVILLFGLSQKRYNELVRARSN